MESQTKVIKQIAIDLNSNDQSVIQKALEKTRAKGNESLIDPLVNLYTTSKDEQIKGEIKGIFSELKNDLQIAKSLSNEQVKNLYDLSEKYQFGKSSVSPSEFDDCLSDVIGFSNHTIATLVLDGESGNYKETLCSDVCETDEEVKQVEELVDRIFAWV